MAKATFLVTFIGRVQGVGFRFLCVRKAAALGVTGWVRNSFEEKKVEACFQGEKRDIDYLVDYFKSNPYNIRVDSVVIEEVVDSEMYGDFQLKY
jgi:acylphosphatase